MQCILVDQVGSNFNRTDIPNNTFKSLRDTNRPECIAFSKTSIRSIIIT